MTRVLIADDHGVLRASLRLLLETAEDMEVVGDAADGARAAELAAELDPDVALMDLSMPGVDGIEGTRRIVAASPRTRVVILTTFSDRERILGALDAGAVGYLLKDAEPAELFAAIRAAARHQRKNVKTHLTNVFQRIGVTDRTQAALWAERHGLIPE